MTSPDWMRPIAAAAHNIRSGDLSSFVPPADGSARSSAVLLLFGESSGTPDILLTERAAGLRRHAGETAFPGGALDPDDAGPAGAALREGAEETGLDPSGIDEPWDTTIVERLPEQRAIERRTSVYGEGRGAACFSG